MLGSGCPPPLQSALDTPPPPDPASPPALKLAGKWEGVGVWPVATTPLCKGTELPKEFLMQATLGGHFLWNYNAPLQDSKDCGSILTPQCHGDQRWHYVAILTPPHSREPKMVEGRAFDEGHSRSPQNSARVKQRLQ